MNNSKNEEENKPITPTSFSLEEDLELHDSLVKRFVNVRFKIPKDRYEDIFIISKKLGITPEQAIKKAVYSSVTTRIYPLLRLRYLERLEKEEKERKHENHLKTKIP